MDKHSISYKIWSDVENIILMYVGSAADFALNPENEWLFYTMQLPSNPQKRFVETFKYNQKMILATEEELVQIAARIRQVHTNLEKARSHKTGGHHQISNKAFREVSDMLIDYGIRGYEYLNVCELSIHEKEEYYQHMKHTSELMGITDFPADYGGWLEQRTDDIENRLVRNEYTAKLYQSYKDDIGQIRFQILLEFQSWFVHPMIAKKLELDKHRWFGVSYMLYPFLRSGYLRSIVLRLMLKPETVAALKSFERAVDKPE